jgi:hypothetical protein
LSDEELQDESSSSENADFGGDGVSSLWEYLLGSNLREANSFPKLEASVKENEVFVVYRRRMPTFGYSVGLEYSRDLLSWNLLEERSYRLNDENEMVDAKLPISEDEKAFVRISIFPVTVD